MLHHQKSSRSLVSKYIAFNDSTTLQYVGATVDLTTPILDIQDALEFEVGTQP